MIRVVLDTNILVSATIAKGGPPGQIVHAWLRDEIELVTSSVLLEELEEVLGRPRIQRHQWMRPEEVMDFVARLKQAVLSIVDGQEVRGVVNDPDDDAVLTAALGGQADYIVSGDGHLLELEQYRDIQIITPTDFLKILMGQP